MSLATKAFSQGIKRIFALPRLSISLIIALGSTLGVVLCVMAIISALLIKPLPGVSNASQLKHLKFEGDFNGMMQLPMLTPESLIAASQYFKDVGEWGGFNVRHNNIAIQDIDYAITSIKGSSNIVDILGSRLILGQGIENSLVASHIWISNTLWKNAFSEKAAAIGKTLTINDKTYIIAGVIEDVLALKSDQPVRNQQIWQLEDYNLSQSYINTSSITDNTVDNVIIKQHKQSKLPTERELNKWFKHFIKNNVTSPQHQFFLNSLALSNEITDYKTHLLGASYYLIIALAITALGLLLMASLNLINLFISHYQTRTKEFAIQLSAGATSFTLRRLMVIENLPSFIIAGIFGTLLGSWIIKALPLLTNNKLPLLSHIHIDALTLIFGGLLVASLSIIFGYLSLMHITKTNIIDNLSASGKGSNSQSKNTASRMLMVLQISIASLLMTSSIMYAVKNYNQVFEDIGMTLDNMQQLTFTITDDAWFESLDTSQLQANDDEFTELQQRIIQSIEQKIPDSKVIKASGGGVLGGLLKLYSMSVDNEASDTLTEIAYQVKDIRPSYFKAMNITVLAGSVPTSSEIDNKTKFRVINERFAKTFFPNVEYDDIIGQKAPIDDTIVGAIVAETGFIATRFSPVLYTYEVSISKKIVMTVALNNKQDLTLEQLKPYFDGLFNRLTLTEVNSLESIKSDMRVVQRLTLYILIGITALTITLAMIGISGLTLMTTHQKKYELAIRMATGAKQFSLVMFILKQTMWVLSIGLLVGFIASVYGYEWLTQQITLLPKFNWLTLIFLDVGIVIVVLLSVLIPTLRVIKKDPLSALRQE